MRPHFVRLATGAAMMCVHLYSLLCRIHVDNLVDALLRAALGLDDRQGGAAAGKVHAAS